MRSRILLPAAAMLAGLLGPAVVLVPAAVAADDGTCVSQHEFGQISSGMSMTKLQKAVHGQTPFADTTGRGKQRYRWYVACEDWKPDLDVAVRYHQPVVGRRTVTKKSLETFVAPG
ncbi:MAG: hypothetical protein ABIO16_18515 [Nocardioides sp.]